ncbi:NERD domain-containing protein [Virgibacillus sp. NKC19-16]|nr:NERD domain-containing protein [Virgibacillus sp. NKC19-16]
MTVTESRELQLLRYLDMRMHLSDTDKQYYVILEKGYEGEQKFAARLEGLSDRLIILHDLLLEWNNTFFQIDTLIIYENFIHLIDVKNYEGEFFIENERWYTKSKKEIKDPVLQLTRCESLLRQLLQHHGVNLPVKSHIIFINPEFTLFQASIDVPIILPSQLNRFLRQLSRSSSGGNKNIKIAEMLVKLSEDESPFTRIPNYDYAELKKGITCLACNSFLLSVKDRYIVCDSCGHEEDTDASILRNVGQFQLLFPNEKITTTVIHDWCNEIKSKKTISRVLNKNFIRIGHGKYSYYAECGD